MYKIKINRQLYEELNKFLFETSPKENGCFLLINTKGKNIYITDYLKPENPNWIVQEEDGFHPSSDYISHAVLKADIKDCGLGFVHTHPNPRHPATFSWIDEKSNDSLFENIGQIITQPLCSLVFSLKGIHGVVYADKALEPIESYTILDHGFIKLMDYSFQMKKDDDDTFNRQILFTGKENQSMISSLEVSVVGCGGIGSPLALQLAKIGVGKINLFDMDKIELTNLPRIYGAKKMDIGKFKVDVLKQHIEEMTSCKVTVIKEKVTGGHERLLTSDIIFGGLDNHATRDVLNTISLQYAIPYIDAACAIPVNNGKVSQAVAKVQNKKKKTPCLWCSGTLNAHYILQESMSIEEKQNLINDGYYALDQSQPSVISLTSVAASMAVNRLFNLIGVYNTNYSAQQIFEVSIGMFNEPEIEINKNCRCQKNNPLLNRSI